MEEDFLEQEWNYYGNEVECSADVSHNNQMIDEDEWWELDYEL